MITFEREQSLFEIAGVKVGGRPGEYPTVLVGSIFYDRHRIVTDPNRGGFDQAKAETLLAEQTALSEKVGSPVILDVVGNTVEALTRYVEFISSATTAPFLVDAPSREVRLPVMKTLAETGLLDRAVYNSIESNITPDEISALRGLGVKSAVLLAYNPKNMWPEGRVEAVEGSASQKGLLGAAKEAGIEKVLVDTAVLDVPSIGLASKAIRLVKERLGLPAGCSPSNAITAWRKMKKEFGPDAYRAALTGSCLIPQMMGANFLLYGPIEYAPAIFPACAMTDALIAYEGRRVGVRPREKNHPLYKLF